MPVECEQRVLAWTWQRDVCDRAEALEAACPGSTGTIPLLGLFSIRGWKRRAVFRVTPMVVGFIALSLVMANIPWVGHAAEGGNQDGASNSSSARTPQIHEIRAPRDVLLFVPALLKIRMGDTVKWVNEGEKTHVLASIPGAGVNDKELFSPMLKPGDTWSHTFENAGDYPYFCFIHSQMMGAVIVEAPAQVDPSAPPVNP